MKKIISILIMSNLVVQLLLPANLTGNSMSNSGIESQYIITDEDIEFEAMMSDELSDDNQQIKEQEMVEEKANQPAVLEWNIGAVRAEGYVNEQADGERVKIALLDSGVDYRPDILIEDSVSMLPDEGMEMGAFLLGDSSGHGTALASLINGVPGAESIKGMNADAQVYSVQVLDTENKGTLSSVVQGIYWAIKNDMDIINMSFGTVTDSPILHKAICDAEAAGIILIAAAGNSSDRIYYPAAYDEVLSVGASTMDGEVSTLSSSGDLVDIYAPGENVLADGPLFGTQIVSGSSVACAEVTAAASIILEKDKSKSADFVVSLLKSSANSGIDVNNDNGLLDVQEAMENYDSYSYLSGNIIPDVCTNPLPVYDECEVEALWNSSEHEGTVPNSDVARGYRVMKAASTYPDLKDSIFKTQRRFHGAKNYWLTLQFLMNLAHAYYIGDDETAHQLLEQADNTYLGKTETFGKIENKESSVEAMKKYLGSTVFNLKNSDRTPLDESSSRNKAYKIMGIAIHTIGDIYAHRTVVTEDMIRHNCKNESSNTDGSYFVRSDFLKGKWLEFENDVKNEKVEFRDIADNYLKYNVDKNGKKDYMGDYEDNPEVAPIRYKAAVISIRRLVENGASRDFRADGYAWASATMCHREILRQYEKTDFDIK